ncbi:hypothetical protein Ae201684_012905 [Aphanomyces euteiches]|uniref:START domain-containing protein n=1 Tax=Aphanomyces euteiches TaxID=100861 RepID=A0A6G0WPW5_9STRA|nr:hypothetical protein Ae201684_012905 [Aphanomyces euteiches]KAH9153052.1 hypothetical protein AeRB84_004629 [Aphanomyces euteiches]
MLTSDDTPRLKETIRKRKYRAGKRRELIDLEAQARRLEAYLAKLQTQHRWVYVNEHPQKMLSNRPTWMESTLLAHPITRRQGIQWLSERIFHQACRTVPRDRSLRGQGDKVYTLDVHVSDDIDDEGVTIDALETRYERTEYMDGKRAADEHWERLLSTQPTITKELIEHMDDRFMYFHHINHRIGTHILTIAGMLQDDDRVVITSCFVAKDELFPHGENIMRLHGFAWTIFESLAPYITLVHNLSYHYTPTLSNGRVIPLEKIGQLFGRSSFGSKHREAYIELIRSTAEAAFIDSHNEIDRQMKARKQRASH